MITFGGYFTGGKFGIEDVRSRVLELVRRKGLAVPGYGGLGD